MITHPVFRVARGMLHSRRSYARFKQRLLAEAVPLAIADYAAKRAARRSGAKKVSRIPSIEVRTKLSEILAEHCLNAAGLDPNVPEDMSVRTHATDIMRRMTEAQLRAVQTEAPAKRPDRQYSPGSYNNALCNTVRDRAGLLGIAAFRYRAWRHAGRAVDIVYDEVERQRRAAKSRKS